MPAALPVSREIVQLMVAQGLALAEIERQTGVKAGTVRQWITRYHWPTPAKLAIQAEVNTGSDRSLVCKALLEKCLERVIRLITTLEPAPHIESLTEHTKLLECMAGTGERLFRWSDNAEKSARIVEVASSVTPIDVDTPTTSTSAQPVTSPTTSAAP